MVDFRVLAEPFVGRDIPPPVVHRETYLDYRVRRADRNDLIDVVFPLHQQLFEKKFDVAILAVGSSVFDAYHWEVREGRTAVGRFLGRRGRRQYVDIDLRLIPDVKHHWLERQRELRGAVRDILSERYGYAVEDHLSAAGSPPNGPFSLRTHLPSGTQLDLLIGYGREEFKRVGILDLEPQRFAIQHQMKAFPDSPYSPLYLPQGMSRRGLYVGL